MQGEHLPWQASLFRRGEDAAGRLPSAPPPDRPEQLPAPAPRPPVEIRTSARRRKTATAYWEEGRIVVVLPAHVRGSRRDELVEWLVARTESRRPHARGSDEALAHRAAQLADRYVDGVRPASIRWVTNQHKRWGSCTSSTGEIRLSHRLQRVPGWVLDAVVVHELTHLVHPDHSAGFHQVADRFPRHAEAALFLEGFALGLEGQPGVGGPGAVGPVAGPGEKEAGRSGSP